MDKLELKALGKINLGLDVLGKRENGYHDVRMVMQTVYLYDQIWMVKTKEPGIRLSTNLFYLPVNENNLAYRAAELLMKEFGIQEGIKIILDKHIPVAAGMAGGSSNAAAVLFGMNRMFSLGLSQKELMERGVSLGADVPYCLLGGCALSEGIGEALTELGEPPACSLLLAKPDIDVSTKHVYESLRLDALERHPDIDGMMGDIEKGDLKGLCEKMENVLETVTGAEYPIIGEIERLMVAEGALTAVMSGSGPTVFGVFREEKAARSAMRAIRERNMTEEVFLSGFQTERGIWDGISRI